MPAEARLAGHKPSSEETEESFRRVCEDACDLIERLSPYYQSVTELVEALQMARANDCVLRVFLKEVTTGKR